MNGRLVRGIALFCIGLAATLALSPAVLAQSGANSGQIVGQVLDPSGAAVPSADVTVRNIGTNYSRTVATDDSGLFAIPVPLGRYAIDVVVAGFETATQQVDVTVGSSVSATFRLTVGAQSEAVDVSAPSIEPTRAQSTTVLRALQIQNVPTPARRLQNLIWDTPGGQIEPECSGMSVAGQKGIFTNVSVDGGDYNTTFCAGTGSFRGGSASGPTFNMDALQEFTVTRNIFAAEFGRTTGGLVNLSTRSGTNAYHGTATYLYRDRNLTANDAFDRPAVAKNQQVSFTLGGPIARDRTFFFVAPEVQKANKPVSVLYSVLDQQNLRNTPGAQALLAIAPEESVSAMSDVQSVVGRLDHQIGQNHRMFVRGDVAHSRALSVTGADALRSGPSLTSLTTSAVSNQSILEVWSGTTLGQITSTFGTSRLNELRVMYGVEDRPRHVQGTGPEVTVQNANQTIAVYGPQGTGISFGNSAFPIFDQRYQIADNFSFFTGAHQTKIGFDLLRVSSDITFAPAGNGVYSFSSLANFLARVPTSYQQMSGSGKIGTTLHHVSLFAQDDWRLRPNLTLSPGFRWDGQFNPDYASPTLPQYRAPGASFIPDDVKQFQPRLGLAWDPMSDGRTVVRAGGGLYYASTAMATFINSIMFNGGNPELGYSVTTTDAMALANAFQSVGVNLAAAPLNTLPVFAPNQLTALLSNPAQRLGLNVSFFDPEFRNPRALQWKVGVDREVASGVMAAVDYVDVHTTGITRQRDVNLGTPIADATGRLIYPATRPLGPVFGVVQITEAAAEARYRAVTSSVNVSRTRLTMGAFYTLSWNKSETDTERPVNAIVYESAADIANDYNWSNLDMRHQFTSTAVVFLPANLQVGATARFLSGRPFTATASGDLNRDGQTRDRPIIDGQVMTRNTFRNRGTSYVDLRVERGFIVGQGRVSVMLDVFNILDLDNVQIGSPNMAYGAGTVLQNGVPVAVAPPAAFGQLRDSNGNYYLSGTPGAPFQAQIGVRWAF